MGANIKLSLKKSARLPHKPKYRSKARPILTWATDSAVRVGRGFRSFLRLVRRLLMLWGQSFSHWLRFFSSKTPSHITIFVRRKMKLFQFSQLLANFVLKSLANGPRPVLQIVVYCKGLHLFVECTLVCPQPRWIRSWLTWRWEYGNCSDTDYKAGTQTFCRLSVPLLFSVFSGTSPSPFGRLAGRRWGWTSQPNQPISASSSSRHPRASSQCIGVQKLTSTNCYLCWF